MSTNNAVEVLSDAMTGAELLELLDMLAEEQNNDKASAWKTS